MGSGRTSRLAVVSLFALLAGVACTTPQPAKDPTLTHAQAQTTGRSLSGCPLGVAGAHVLITDTEGGVAMTLTVDDPAMVVDLRERVVNAAMQHGPGAGAGKGHGGHHGEGGHHGLRAMLLPPSDAKPEDVARGARLTLVPADAADLPILRTKVRERVREWAMAGCSSL